MKQEQTKVNVDLNNTLQVTTPTGKKIFQQGYLLRSVSKFLVGGTEDALMPIPVFFDPESGKIVRGTLPPELREEYQDDLI